MLNHILTTDQFTTDELAFLVGRAASYAITKRSNVAQGKILTNLFYEASTRTSSSFYAAMVKLGGHVIPINDVQYSSVSKGESLEDTIRTLECYSDVIVLRHKEVGAAKRAATVASMPIINAGDGVGEHPTQALLDFYTILTEREWTHDRVDLVSLDKIRIQNCLDGLKVTMMGDLNHGRTVKSLAKLLRKYGVSINWIAPQEFRIPKEFVESGDFETDDLQEVIQNTDVLYMVRAQKERHDSLKTAVTDLRYGITTRDMEIAKPNMVLMHPLPRQSELPTDLDADPRSAYFRQMKNGLFMRMAVLESVL